MRVTRLEDEEGMVVEGVCERRVQCIRVFMFLSFFSSLTFVSFVECCP